MAARKLKLVEANDGSYGGLVLAAFDAMKETINASECTISTWKGVAAEFWTARQERREPSVFALTMAHLATIRHEDADDAG